MTTPERTPVTAMQPYQAAQPPAVRPAGGSGETIAAWIITVLTVGYMLPWAVAATRRKSNSGGIAVLNFLLGWTLIGWVVALVMAVSAEKNAPSVVVMNSVTAVAGTTAPPPGWYPAPSGDGQRYWDGTGWTDHSLA